MLSANVRRFWQDFCYRHNMPVDTPAHTWSFSTDPAAATDKAELVRRGIKTASTALVDMYDQDNASIPHVGEYNIVMNGMGEPVCVVQLQVVEVTPFGQISEEHAYHEGEGDRSYDYWREVHSSLFSDQLDKINKGLTDATPCVSMVFSVIK